MAECPKCKTKLQPGKAIEQTSAGIPDFIGLPDTVCTMSPGGPGKLVGCLKCLDCGLSFLPKT